MPMAERPGRRFHRGCQPVSPSKRNERSPLERSWVTDQLVTDSTYVHWVQFITYYPDLRAWKDQCILNFATTHSLANIKWIPRQVHGEISEDQVMGSCEDFIIQPLEINMTFSKPALINLTLVIDCSWLNLSDHTWAVTDLQESKPGKGSRF